MILGTHLKKDCSTNLAFQNKKKINNKIKITEIKLSVLDTFPGNGAKNLLDHKGCKPKCRFSQVIILGKYEVDPQGMVDTK